MKKCKQGYYYCYKDKKCKKIPLGYRVGLGGWLRREKEEEKEEEQKNGNGANGNGNGNGDSSGDSNGGGVSEAWSAKYKKSINCNNPKGFSQRAHCQGRKKVNEAKEKDHEVSMAQSQLKKSEENIRKLRKALGKKEKNIPAWVQAKITDTEHNTDAAAGYMDEGKRDGKSAKDKGYSLRDWFKGGGWVQAGGKYDGKPCARQPGQKTKPFCRDADDRASMSKDERERRAKKKRREDPNPDRKGSAKIVTEMSSEKEINKKIQKKVNTKDLNPAEYIKNTNMMPGSGIQKKLANSYQPEGDIVDEGKKDACYHKVKSRYSVWPSAYASGALVKCRKVGAKNWGNKTKKEGYDFSNWRDDFKEMRFDFIDIIKPEPLQATDGIGSRMLEEGKGKKCWKGYKKAGTQKLFGKTYNRCVKEGSKSFGQFMEDWQKVNKGDKTDGMSQKAVNAYKRENPGSKLQTAVTEKKPTGKRAKRRTSFCARSKGQKDMHNIDCTKTPDKAICKARKRWNCR